MARETIFAQLGSRLLGDLDKLGIGPDIGPWLETEKGQEAWNRAVTLIADQFQADEERRSQSDPDFSIPPESPFVDRAGYQGRNPSSWGG